MLALSALPDHEVTRALLPDIVKTHLDHHDALRKIAKNRCIIPIAIDPVGHGKVYWADVGKHPFREWQFTYTVKYLAESGSIKSAFTTDFDILKDDAIGADGIYPGGLIFHISRCGSTLIAKGLARLDSNIVITQGGPLQRGFWAKMTDDFRKPLKPTKENLAIFRRLVLAMTRRRTDRQVASFLKFVSWNVVHLDFIQKAFPDVPALFLYRNPVEVIASTVQRPTPALLAKGGRQAPILIGDTKADTMDMSDTEYLAHCCAQYFRAALGGVKDGLKVLNYTSLGPEHFPEILSRALQVNPTEDELTLMVEQFKYHSKDDQNTQEFRGDSDEKSKSVPFAERAMIKRLCKDLVKKLDQSKANLFPVKA